MSVHSSTNKEAIWGMVFILILISLVGIIIFTKSHKLAQPGITSGVQAPAITTGDWVTGNKDAKVSVIEYGDFQCPACAAYHPMVQQMLSEYGDRIVFVFRNFPLTQHKNAWVSAQAAGAAGLQGKYWNMNNLLYEKQTDWGELSSGDVKNKLDEYASSLGLDMNKFHQDMDSDAVKNKIRNDSDGGNRSQVDHTPTFFINRTQITNPSSYADLKSAIDKALATP